jgi:diacylglycerol kinase
VVALAAAYDVSTGTWAILLVCIGAVLSVELVNSAIETLADRVEPEQDPAIRDTKDIAAAAVLVTCGVAAVTGVVVLWPYIVN